MNSVSSAQSRLAPHLPKDDADTGPLVSVRAQRHRHTKAQPTQSGILELAEACELPVRGLPDACLS